MVGFWISAGAMVLMVAVLLAQAMRQARSMSAGTGAATEVASEMAVYRDQLADVENDLKRGVLAPAEAERLRLEVQRRMLDAGRHAAPAQGETASAIRVPPGLAVLAILICLGGGVAIYYRLGVPGYPDLPLSLRFAMADEAYQARPTQDEAEAAQPAFVTPDGMDTDLVDMIAQLRLAVADRPDDVLGHTLLAQNEAALGNFAAARKAQEVVVRLKGDGVTAEDLSALAQLMVAAAGGTVTPEAEKVLIDCLQRDPRNGWARYYSGLMFAEIGRPDRAFALWEPLVREGPADAPWLRPVSSLIESVADAAGIAYVAPPVGSNSGGPDAAAMAAAGEMSAEDRAEMIAGMVDGLEDRLASAGGPVEEWVKLITSLSVLNEGDRAKAAYARALAAFEGDPGALAALRAAAVQAGVAE